MVNSKKKRFLLSMALLFLLVLFMGVGPADNCDLCDTAEKATVNVKNYSSGKIKVYFAGPTTTDFTLSQAYQKSVTVSVGSYTITAYGAPYYNSEMFRLSFTIGKNQVKDIPIY